MGSMVQGGRYIAGSSISVDVPCSPPVAPRDNCTQSGKPTPPAHPVNCSYWEHAQLIRKECFFGVDKDKMRQTIKTHPFVRTGGNPRTHKEGPDRYQTAQASTTNSSNPNPTRNCQPTPLPRFTVTPSTSSAALRFFNPLLYQKITPKSYIFYAPTASCRRCRSWRICLLIYLLRRIAVRCVHARVRALSWRYLLWMFSAARTCKELS